MRTLLAAHQPDLLPYTGFWYKLYTADVFDLAIWDQINWKGYTARVHMAGSWASLPVIQRRSAMRICDVRIVPDAADYLINVVKGRYRRAPFWADRGEQVLYLIDEARAETLWQFNLALLLGVRDMLGIATPISIAPAPTMAKTGGIAQLCFRYEAFDYLAGVGSKAYLDVGQLQQNAIRTHWSTHEPWTEDSILTTLFEKEDPMAWVRKEIG